MIRKRVLLLVISLCLSLAAPPLQAAACVNKYVAQKTANKLSLTLLTGTLDFDDAKKLAEGIASGEREPIAWVGPDGKVIAKQWGPLKVVRPMPVACEGKSSGVVVQATFPTIKNPTKIMTIVFDPNLTVDFVSQNN